MQIYVCLKKIIDTFFIISAVELTCLYFPIFDNLTTKISFHNFYFDEIISNINKIHENMY